VTSIFRSEAARQGLVDRHDRVRASLPAPTTSRRIPTRFGETHVLVGGDASGSGSRPPGPADDERLPLVLLHGALATSALLLRELAPLMASFRVHAVDIVGQSALSADRRISVKNDDYGRWMVEVLDALELPHVGVVGVSWGGFVALRLAAHAPDRIERMALVAPAGVVRSPLSSFFRMGWPLTRYLASPNAARLDALLSQLLSTPDDDWTAYLGEAFLAFDLSMTVPRRARPIEFRGFDAPAFVVGCERDVSFPGVPLLARARELLPNVVRTELLRGANHSPPTTDEFRRWMSGELAAFFGKGPKSSERPLKTPSGPVPHPSDA
jgi:2-hydroxy-6-oxonona-2,4-dienedioate hydrolase